VGPDGEVILHDHVAPTAAVTDWRTAKTGLSLETWPSQHILASYSVVHVTNEISASGAILFSIVQERVKAIIRGKKLVGHSLWIDLNGRFCVT
jgi:hypothetical protein